MKKGILFIIVCTIANMVYAQKADTTVVFSKTVHDFGVIVRSDGLQSYSFEYTNRSSVPITIQKVASSCGCTISDWTKVPVASGEKGYVKAEYTPSGVTTFDKSITVSFAGGSPEVIVLRIRGKVTE
jgi:hypothetical protein